MKPKQLIILWLMLTLCLASCEHPHYPKALIDANRLAYTCPDSSIDLLNSVSEHIDELSTCDKKYFNLLMIKSHDKANRLNVSPHDILSLVDYYSTAGDNTLLPEALYYAGRVYRTNNDAPEARSYFLRALETIDKMPPSPDNEYIKGKCLSQLGSIYLYQNLYEESAKMYQKAFETNECSHDTVGMIFNLRDIANSYISLNKPDSSLIYTRRGINLAMQIKDSLFLNELYLLEAGALIQKKYYVHAQKSFLKASGYSPKVESITQITIGTSLCYAVDSISACKRYALKLLENGNIYDKRTASRVLAEIAMRENNPDTALMMIRFYRQYDDSATKQNRAETILKMNALYDYSLKEEENRELRVSKARVTIVFSAIVTLLVIVLLMAIFYIRYKRQQQQLLKLKLEKYETLKKANETKPISQIEKEEKIIIESNIYRKIKTMVNSSDNQTGLSEDDWIQVIAIINSAYPHFKESLLDLCQMNENELRVCMLLKIGLVPSAIAQLTYHSKESVSATRRRLFEKAFGQKRPPKDWDNFIRTL